MNRWRSLRDVPQPPEPTAVAIGNFDGVHLGHQEVVRRLRETAAESGLKTLALTFDPHPLRLHRPTQAPPIITATEDKLDLLEATGLDSTLVLPYTAELAALEPEEFVAGILVNRLGVRAVVAGCDIRFGRNRAGNLQTMVELGAKYGFTVRTAEEFERPAGEFPRRCSSSWVRQLLAEGDVAQAAAVLGRPHFVRGEVVHGAKRGRELGFPTANLSPESFGMIPADGVYAAWLEVDGERFPAAVSVGNNPTFEGVALKQVEAHVVGRPEEPVEDFDLYGRQAKVVFVERLRGMVAYEGVEALCAQMRQDVRQTEAVLDAVST